MGSVLNANNKPILRRIQKMKVVAKFLGKVNEFNKPPALSYVTLKNVDTGEEIDTDAVSQMLLDAGIDHEDVEFEVLVTEENGKHTAVTKKLGPRPLSEADLKAISDEVDAKLPPADFTI
jgi:hypothetical protein